MPAVRRLFDALFVRQGYVTGAIVGGAIIWWFSSCALAPELTWSLEMVTWFDDGPVFQTGYYFTQEQCQDAIEGIRVAEGTRYTAVCEPIERVVGRSLEHFKEMQ